MRARSLPIPTVLAFFTFALPAISGLAMLSTTTIQNENQMRHDSLPQFFSNQPETQFSLLITVFLLTIYETVVVALSATYIGPPSNLACGLESKWAALFHEKRENIPEIQDAYHCCGLHSPLDRAWPYPAKGVGADACKNRFAREKSCFADWQADEQKTATIMLVVGLLVFLWMVSRIRYREHTLATSSVTNFQKVFIISAQFWNRSAWVERNKPNGADGEYADQRGGNHVGGPRLLTTAYEDDPAGDEAFTVMEHSVNGDDAAELTQGALQDFNNHDAWAEGSQEDLPHAGVNTT